MVKYLNHTLEALWLPIIFGKNDGFRRPFGYRCVRNSSFWFISL